MRKRIIALLVALGTIGAGVAVSSSGPAGALVEGVVDVAVRVDVVTVDGTDNVSPPGAHALYELEGYNNGLVPVAAAVVSIDLPAGSVYTATAPTASCSASGTRVTCPTGPLGVGGSKVFEIAASTPTTAGTYEVVATIQEQDPLVEEPLEFQANNRDVTTVMVVPANGPGAYGLVLGGRSIVYKHPLDGRVYELHVPASSPGVIVSIEPDDGVGRTCGPHACGKGFHADFVQHDYFSAKNVKDPIVTKRTYGVPDPCRGIGGDCTEIYFAKDFEDLTLDEMEPCSIAGTAVPDPCLARKYKKSPGSVWFDVLMTSADPLDIPPLLL
ncbi:MAG TPA: hypothetical protein VM933_02440 [Acidimicrobiales bacterium]|nr:hypothetical protein [Acidimicrobiales bacterium]